MIPEGWTLTTLGEVCKGKIQTGPFGSQLHSYEYVEAGIPVIMPKDLLNGRIVPNRAARIPQEKANLLEKHKLKIGDIVFSRRGDVSCAAIVKKNEVDYICGTGCLRARPNKDNIFAPFLNILVQTEDIKSWLKSNSVGQTMPNMNSTILSNLPLLLPPLPEQHTIAEILSSWDKAIALLEQLITAKRKLKQGLMQQLLTGKKRFKEFEGSEWEEYYLGNLFNERKENCHEQLPLLSITREKGIVSREEIERKDTSNSDKSKYLRICPGDIGYNTMRMWQGVSALSELEGIVSPAYTVLIPTKKADGRFFSFLFKYQPITFTFQRYSQGLTSDTWNLKFDNLSKIKVTIPSINEQQKIASILSAADAEISTL